MVELVLKKKHGNLKSLIKTTTVDKEEYEVISGDVTARDADSGETLFVMCNIGKEECKEVLDVCQSVRYLKTERTDGLKTISRTFGFYPRNPVRRNCCGATDMAYEFPKEFSELLEFGGCVADVYFKNCLPQERDKQSEQLLASVKPCWIIPRTTWTSGIINKNNPLKYHRDNGNLKHSYSAMLTLRKDVGGGWLQLPEYEVTIKTENNSLFLFRGGDVLHGVTPFRLQNSKSYRYTVVYYPMELMKNCLEAKEELQQYKTWITNVQTKRAQHVPKPS